MRELTTREIDLASGGCSAEFRARMLDGIWRFDHTASLPTTEAHVVEDFAANAPPDPIPLHWLPPRDELPQVF